METLLCIQVQINTDGSNDSYINAAKAAGVLASAVIFFYQSRQTERITPISSTPTFVPFRSSTPISSTILHNVRMIVKQCNITQTQIYLNATGLGCILQSQTFQQL